jgi:hypothetical protein
VKKANTKWWERMERLALVFVQNCGHEFISAKDFDIVDEGNHGVVVEVMQRNVLEDFLGNVWGAMTSILVLPASACLGRTPLAPWPWTG